MSGGVYVIENVTPLEIVIVKITKFGIDVTMPAEASPLKVVDLY